MIRGALSVLQVIILESQDITSLSIVFNRYKSFFLIYRTFYSLMIYDDIKFFCVLLSMSILTSILFYIVGYINVFQYFNSFRFLIVANILYLYSICCLQTKEFKISLNISYYKQLDCTPFLSLYIKYSFEIYSSLLNVIFETFSDFKPYIKSSVIL